MRFKFLLFITIVLIVCFPDKVLAHATDNAYTYLFIEKTTEGADIGENQIIVFHYTNWFIVGELFYEKNGKIAESFEQLAENKSLVQDYISESTKIINNGKECSRENYNPYSEDEAANIESLDSEVIYKYSCDEKIRDVKIENKIGIEMYPFMSNFVTIQRGEQVLEKVTLGAKNISMDFNLRNLIANPVGDISVDYSAGMTTDQIKGDNSTKPNREEIKKSSFLGNLSEKIFVESNNMKDKSPFILIALVFILGLLHTLEAGHSKAILASSMLHKNMNFKRGMLYVLVFTGTHLGDIIVIGILFMVVNNFYDIFSNFTLIEKFAGYAVFFLALYMLIRNLTELIKHKLAHKMGADHHHDHDHSEHSPHSHSHGEEILTSDKISLREQLVMGILTGLAPCIFGWSIFMLVISTGKIWLLFPVIFSFGFGIFIALTLVVVILNSIKKAAYPKVMALAEYSPIISSAFLLLYAILLVM